MEDSCCPLRLCDASIIIFRLSRADFPGFEHPAPHVQKSQSSEFIWQNIAEEDPVSLHRNDPLDFLSSRRLAIVLPTTVKNSVVTQR